ncbi:hypothetical protein SK128_013013, partial [Halocaridina rubra]
MSVDIDKMHNMHHMGVDRTLYLTRIVDPTVDRNSVLKDVRSYKRCQSVDPVPVTHCP